MMTDGQNGESRQLVVAKKVGVALAKMAPEYRAILPAHVAPDAFIRVAQTAIQMNEDLQQCTPKSLIGACTKLAETGLLPDGEQAAIVAYNVKVKRRDPETGLVKESWEKQAKAMPMVRGIRDLVRRSGEVKDWKVRLVYSQDHFRHIDGDVELLEHEPAYVDGDHIVKVYSIAYLENGELSRHVMRIEAVDKIRQRSRSKDSGPWVTDYEEMAKKTCLKQHSKALPKAKDDLNRQRIMGAIRAVDEAEDVLQLDGARQDMLAPPAPSMREAASKRLALAAETAVFDDVEEALPEVEVVHSPPSTAHAAPKTTRKRRSSAERVSDNLAKADAKQPPAASPATQEAKNGAPAIDEGRDLEFEREQAADVSGYDGADDVFPGDIPSADNQETGDDEEERSYRAGWHARSHSKARVPPRDVKTQENAAAWLEGWDTYDKAAKIGNAPKTAQASEAMLDEVVNKVFV